MNGRIEEVKPWDLQKQGKTAELAAFLAHRSPPRSGVPAEVITGHGNLGYGPLRSKSTEVLGPLTRNKGSYTLGEFGLAYRLLEPSEARWLSSVSLQLGYRIQIVAYDDIELPTLRLDGTPLSVERTNARPLTQGMALGLSASF